MRTIRSLLILTALIAGGIVWWTNNGPPTSSAGQEPAATSATVSRVIDGDTFVVGGSTRVRVLGIDTPEEGRDGRAPECGAREATAVARDMLDGQDVDLTADASQSDSDAYGRLLRYVELTDGRDLAHELLSAGHAIVYTPVGTIGRQDAYEAAEEAGRTQDRAAPRC